jgi:CheY-like chemotaxis protein
MTSEGDRPQRILILDDEMLIALELESIVRDLGFDVLGPVGDVEAALSMARQEQIDAAVLDIHLNGNSTSYPVAEALESRRIPFMFVTGIDKRRLGELFALDYELLLYDVTSTYFEGQAAANPLARRGHSRDHRPDCKQVCIGLVVTRDACRWAMRCSPATAPT